MVENQVKITLWERVLRWRDFVTALFPSMEGRWRRITVVSFASAIAAGAAGLLLWNVGKATFGKKAPQFPIGMADGPKPAAKPAAKKAPAVKKPAKPSVSLPWGFPQDGARY